MEGLAEILGVLAILISLASLWMVAEAVKKAEEHSQKFFETHIRSLKEKVTDQQRTFDALTRRIDSLEAEAQHLREGEQNARNQMMAVETGLRGLNEAIKALDRSIPQRYRVRTGDKPDSNHHSVQ